MKNLSFTIRASDSNIVTTSKKKWNPAIAFMTAAAVLITSTLTAQEVCPVPPQIIGPQSQAAPIPVSQIPLITSNPGRRGVIFIDCSGPTLTQMAWIGSGPSIDLDPPEMTAAEITTAFWKTAEDFKPFELTLTTDSTLYHATPPGQRQRIVWTSTSFRGGIGGVAFTGTFASSTETWCFAFTRALGSNPQHVGDCSSHEVGHTLGLAHIGLYDPATQTLISTYHPVIGTGDISKGIIMGNSYYSKQSIWVNDRTTVGYNVIQDEIAQITSQQNRIGLVARTTGTTHTITSATRLTQVISPGRTDSIYLTVPTASAVTIVATSGGNTDVQLKFNGSSSNIVDSLSTRMNTSITGTKLLEISGVGNVNNPTGYGSCGEVFLSFVVTPLSIVSLDTNRTAPRNRLADFRFDKERIYFKSNIFSTYNLVSMSGQVVKAGSYRAGRNEISIGLLPIGVYVLRTEIASYQVVKY